MTIQECIVSIEQTTARLKTAGASLQAARAKLQEQRQIQAMRSALHSEPAILPPWKRKGTWKLPTGEIIEFPKARSRQERTLYLRRDHGEPEVRLLRAILAAPTDPHLAMRQWRARYEAHKQAFQAAKVARSR